MHTKIIILFCLLWSSIESVKAQLELYPLRNVPTRYAPPTGKGNNLQARDAPLNLPFFEDFSTYTGNPDTLIWVKEGGAFINQQFADAPISLGIATLDGIDANGSPYDFSNFVNTAIGPTDTLTSCPIDLSVHTPADSIYLSFYWQMEGRGERPDIEDSLRLQLRDNTGEWHTVWRQTGGRTTAPFALIMIPIKAATYFYEEFQFRFQSFGRQSGVYDVWHVDYIYMNNNRSFNDFYTDEITCSRTPNFLLSRYTAMPLKQYFANPGLETLPQVSTTINNLSVPTEIDAPSYRCILTDLRSNTEIAEIASTAAFVIDGDARDFEITADVPEGIIPFSTEPLEIQTQFIVSTGDSDNQIPPIDLRRNDTISSITVLDDYYAYDDGTAEYGAGVNQRFGQVAVQFELNQPDTLTDVLIHIVQLEANLIGQTYNLVIWKSIGEARDSVIYKVNVPIRYSDTRNQFLSIDEVKRASDAFFRFPAIPLEAGTFYVGWEQTTNDRLTVGYDRNNDFSDKIFFNVGNQWNNFLPQEEDRGALMLRPVFGEVDFVTNLPSIPEEALKVYPNPAQEYLILEGNLPEYIELFDAQGRKHQSTRLPQSQQERYVFALKHLSAGLYFLRAYYANQKIITQKIIIN